jgi:hypothetical protein
MMTHEKAFEGMLEGAFEGASGDAIENGEGALECAFEGASRER